MSPVENAQQVFNMDPASTTDKREDEMVNTSGNCFDESDNETRDKYCCLAHSKEDKGTFFVKFFTDSPDFCAENPHRNRLPLHFRRLMERIPDPGLRGTAASAYRYGMYIEPATKLVNTMRKEVMYALRREKGPTFADVNSLKQNIMRLHRILFGTWALLVQDYDLCLDIESEHGDSVFPHHLLPAEGLREN